MNWYPQVGAGSIAQFPFGGQRVWRAIRNVLESGEQIVLPDDSAGQMQWRLSYVDLTDAETQQISDLFTACCGTYGSFGFVDPSANLIAWSEDLSRADWQKGQLGITAGVNDPLGGVAAWAVANGAAGPLALMQSVGIPGSYVACFSVWLRAATRTSVALRRDSSASTVPVSTVWQRAYITGAGDAGASSATVSIEIPAGQTVQLFGAQLEAQPYPSQYKPSGAAAGIYEETYFGDDSLTITSTGVGLSSCDVKLTSRILI